ncbi:glycoside hydrolase 5 family protein [Paenibacillus psychroresistens]|nr:cellulase family glycosylhydrolase [Paenibacillus psychroresistens]
MFAYADGTYFIVDEKPFYFQGNNTYFLGLLEGRLTLEDIDRILAENARMGIKVMRIWAFNSGPKPGAIQPKLDEFNEEALQRLDYVVNKAKEHGIMLILPFVNYWEDLCGMQWYVDETLGSGHSINEFYTDETVKSHYRNYIRMLIERRNIFTNVLYRDEPAIFAWELANEPRNKNDDFTGTKLFLWASEMAQYIKVLDPNHMVATGEEGFKTGDEDWVDNGSEGLDFSRNISIPEIDFATVHLYMDGWDKDYAWTEAFMQDRAAIAKKSNKPIVLEEYGRPFEKMDQREEAFRFWHSKVLEFGYAGAMVWQMEDTDDLGFAFSFKGNAGQTMLEQSMLMNAKA